MPSPSVRISTLPLRRSAPLAAVALSALCGAWVLIATLRMIVLCWNKLPFGDQWGEIVTGRHINWAWLTSQHVEHRILFPRLVFWADRVFAQETNALNEAVIVLIQCTMLALLLLLARLSGLTDQASRIWAAGFCAALLFWAGQYQNFVWGFQVQFLGVVLAAAGTFAALALLRPSGRGLAVAIAIETVGVYTLASGVLIPVLAVALAVVLRRPRRDAAVLAIACITLLASYLWGYHTPPESSDPLAAWRAAGSMFLYLLVVLGAPIGNVALLGAPLMWGVLLAAAAGALGVYAFLRLGWRLLEERARLMPAQACLFALAAFVLGMFAITAAGRLRFGIGSALASRYTSPAVVFWCCIIVLITSRASRHGRVPARMLAGFLVLPLLMAATEGPNVSIARGWVSLRRAATPAILAGVADTELLVKVYAIPGSGDVAGSQLQRHGPAMRRAATGVFADPWAAWLGTPLATHVSGVDPSLCAGALETIRQVATGPDPGFRATGHAWRTRERGGIDNLVMTDEAGSIIGYGAGHLSFAAIGLPGTDTSTHPDAAWIGAFRHTQPASVTAYALVGSAACPLDTRLVTSLGRVIIGAAAHP